jgi:hypothetical protein
MWRQNQIPKWRTYKNPTKEARSLRLRSMQDYLQHQWRSHRVGTKRRRFLQVGKPWQEKAQPQDQLTARAGITHRSGETAN